MKCNPWVGGSIGRRGFPMLGTGKRGLSTYVKDLFSNSKQGFAYDPNAFTARYQDIEGTTPVTTSSQPIAKLRDLSGQELHAFQPSADLRPLIIDRWLQYPVNLSGDRKSVV